MSFRSLIHATLILVFAGFAAAAVAQPLPYGAPISLENAKKAASAAVAEARKNGWNMAVSVVDPGGHLVYFERMDPVQVASVAISEDKARSAATFKRPTKTTYDELEKGGSGLRWLSLRGAVASEGGELLVMDGKIVGAIGLSGGSGAQDGQCARAGVAAVK